MAKKQDKADKEMLQRLALIFDEAMQDCEFFIEKFVKIEDRDSDTLAAPFELWPKQRAALRSIMKNRLNIALKARQLGISWLALAIAAHMIMHPGKSVLALSKTEEDAKELVRRIVFILRNLPTWMIIQSNAPLPNTKTYDYMATQVTVETPGAEPSFFRSFPAGQNSGAGFTGNLLILDEWALQQYDRQIWRAVFPTVNRPTGGKVIGISTIRLGTLYEEIVRGALAGTNDFNLIFLPWSTDPRRDKDWYEKTRRNMTEEEFKQEYPATISEALESAGGKFFGELDPAIHIVKPREVIPAHYKRYRSIDYGFDGCAVLWYYIDFRGYARVYKEFFGTDLTVSEAAEEIIEITGDDEIVQTFAPDDLWNSQTTSGKSAADLFGEHKIWLTKTSRKREAGWLNVREWLRPHEVKEIDGNTFTTAKLTFEVGTQSKIWMHLNALLSDKNNPRDAAKEPHNITHLPDSLRAFCVFWQSPSTEQKTIQTNTIEDRARRDIERIKNKFNRNKVTYCR